jgi:thermitase
VGASDQNDQRASFSNYGANWVDVASPGVGILSTTMDGKYEAWDGTSMATPIVAGLVGLMKSYNPDATNVELRAALEDNTDNIGGWIAKGRVNGFKAISAILKAVEKDFPVDTVGVYANQGSSLAGVATGLAKADGSRVSLKSVLQPNVGGVAAMQSSLKFTQDPSTVRSASFVVQGQSSRGVTVQFYLYNFNTGRYDIVKAFSASGGYDTVEVPVRNLSPYISGTEMRTITRGFVPLRSNVVQPWFNLQLDVLKLKAKVNP